MSDREQLSDLMAEARELVSRLGDDDHKAETLVKRARSLLENVSSMRDYQKSIEAALSTSTFGERRKALLGELQRENREILALQEENRSLKEAMEECLGTLEMVMVRHRQVVTRMEDSRDDEILTKLAQALQSRSDILKQSEEEKLRFRQMAYSLLAMLEKSEEESEKFVMENARLKRENTVLREVLTLTQISDPQPTRDFRAATKPSQKSSPVPLKNGQMLENGCDSSDDGSSSDDFANRTVVERATLDASSQ